MTVIYVSIQQFKKKFIDKNTAQYIFESKDRIVASLTNGATVQAFKKTDEKLSNHSIPFTAIGYPGIATAECKRLDIDIAAEIHADFDKLPLDEQSKILKELSTPKPEEEEP